MGLKDPRTGYNSATEFMVAGFPWVLSETISNTVVKHSFDKITKHIKIRNHAADGVYVRLGFTINGINGIGTNYYYRINGQETLDLDARVKEIFLLRDSATDCAISIYAELVGVDASMMPVLTGSIDGVTFWEGVG